MLPVVGVVSRWLTAAFVFVVSVTVPATPAGAAEPQAAPYPTVVSITFDDTFAEQADAMQVLVRHGMGATLYVNSPRIGSAGYLNQEQLDSYVAAGSEVGGHTLTHANLATSTTAEAKKQVCNDRVSLLERGYPVTSFAYPFGSTSSAVKQVVAECGYNSARGVAGLLSPGYGCTGCPTAETIPPADPWKIRTPESVKSDTTLEMLQSYVTRAEDSTGGWVPLTFHRVCSGCAPNAVDLETFTAFVGWLSQRPATTEVKTVHQVVGGDVKPGVPYVPSSEDASAVTVGDQVHAIDGTNTYRGTDMLVLYKRAPGSRRTGTNAFGTEAKVIDGQITRVVVGVGNMRIPRGGFVLSGHGASSKWLQRYATVGSPVAVSYGSSR